MKIEKRKTGTKKRISKTKGCFTKTNTSDSQFKLWHPRVAPNRLLLLLINHIIKKEKEFSFIASGQSMAPLIPPGSHLFVRQCPLESIKIGDIVFFKQGKDFLTHRLIYKNKNICLIKADASPLPDSPIKPAQILGKVTKIEKNGKVFSPEALVKIQNLFYLNEFYKLNRLFWENNLKVVGLKGIALSQQLREKLPNRVLSDLDFLIQRKDFPQVARILRNAGFRIEKQSPNQQEITFKKGGVLPLAVDVHQEPVGSTKGKLNPLPLKKNQKISQDLIKRARLVKEKGGEFWVLEENDLLFYLCLHHFFHHNCRGIEQLVNIAQVIEKVPIDWKIFGQRVKSYSLKTYLYYPLFLTKTLLKAKVPQTLLKEFKPKSVFAKLVPCFINQKNVFRPRRNITQPGETNKENIVLRFLIIDKPFLWKIWYLTRPRVLFGFRPYLKVLPLARVPS